MSDPHSHSHSHSPGAHAHAHAHDDHHSPEAIKAAVRKYMIVFGALLVGTVLTVALYYVHFHSVMLTITIALFVASVKSFLVAGYFMHLIDERKMIYGVLASTVFFFIALMFLTIWSMHDFPSHTLVGMPTTGAKSP